MNETPELINFDFFRNGNCNGPRQSDALKLFGARDVLQRHLIQAIYSDHSPRLSPAQQKKKRSIAGIALVKDKNHGSFPGSPISACGDTSIVASPKNRRLEWTATTFSETADSFGSSDSLDTFPTVQKVTLRNQRRTSSAGLVESNPVKQESKRLNFPEIVELFQTFTISMRKDLMDLFHDWSVPTPNQVLQSFRLTNEGDSTALDAASADHDGRLSAMERVMTISNLIQFKETKQQETCSVESAREIIQRFENHLQLKALNLLSYEGFARLMNDTSNFAFLSENLQMKEEDMHHPLSHYFIASSHNTYLTGHQLKGG